MNNNEYANFRTGPDNDRVSTFTSAQGSQKLNARGQLHMQVQVRNAMYRGKEVLCSDGKRGRSWFVCRMLNDTHGKLSSGVNDELLRFAPSYEAQ